MMADYGALSRGLTSGIHTGLDIQEAKRRERMLAEESKRRDTEQKLSTFNTLLEKMEKTKSPEFSKSFAPVVNKLGKELFPEWVDIDPSKVGTPEDGTKALTQLWKSSKQFENMNDRYQFITQGFQSVANTQDKDKVKGLSEYLGGMATADAQNPLAESVPTGKMEIAPTNYAEQAKYMGLASGSVSSGGGGGYVNPTVTPQVATSLQSDRVNLANKIKALTPDPEVRKRIDDELAKANEAEAATLLTQRQGQPEEIQKSLENEAITNTGPAGQKLALPVIKEERAAKKDDAMMGLAIKRGDWKPPQPWGMTTAPDGTQVAVGFDPNARKVVTYPVPFTGQIDPITKGRTPASEVGKGVMLDTISGNLERIRQTYNPDYVGFITGRAKQLQASTVGGLDEKQASFYADVNDIADMLLRARSGAQINEQEYNRLSKLVPTPNLPPSTFTARLNRFETQLKQTMANQQKRLKTGGYMTQGKSAESAPKERTITRRGKTKDGRSVVQYSDGSIEYGN
jgi:hypothetical protein